MKKYLPLVLSALIFCTTSDVDADSAGKSVKDIKIAVVNFKSCVENSKLGKQEQANFESLKKQMETLLEDKEKELNAIADKFNDADYLDSLSLEAETEMKRKFRQLGQELSQYQNQYMQTLQQANFQIVQKLTEKAQKASSEAAKAQNIDLVLTEEGSFFYIPSLDISKEVVAYMDKDHEEELKTLKDKPSN